MAQELQYDILKKELNKLGAEVVAEIKKVLIQNDKKATGDLISSIDFRVVDILGTLALNILGEDYLQYVISGRKAGKKAPPFRAIRKWIDDKPIKQFRDKRGRFITKKSQTFLIARSIGKKGIKPLPAINGSINAVIRRKKEVLSTAMGQDIIKSLKNILIN
jgi:hypothetical protein